MTAEQVTDTQGLEHPSGSRPDPGAPLEGQARQDNRPAQPPDTRQPASDQALQAYATRRSMEIAQLKRMMGLPNEATFEDMKGAWEGRQAPAPSAQLEGFDPELEEQRATLREEAWAYQEERYGKEQVSLVRRVENLVYDPDIRTPSQLMAAVLELAKSIATQPSPGQAPPQQSPRQGEPPRPPAPHEIAPEGDAPAGWYAQPEPEEKGSGDVTGALERLFSRVNVR